jgi:hypothetical protein
MQAEAMARRQGRVRARIVWFENQVLNNINIGMRARIKIACQLLRDQTVINISKPVRKEHGRDRRGRFKVRVTERSRPGEFPRADTTRLMKDIFWQLDEDGMGGIVGTTLDYGVILETRMNRSFLRRTFNEMGLSLRTILLAGRGGGRSSDFPGQE